MKRRTIYALAVPAFALIAGSAVVAAMGDTFPARGYTFLLTVVPLVLLFMAMIAMNSEIAVPLLLRHRYRSYLVVAMLMALLIPMASLGMEYIVRLRWGVPQRVDDWLSPWLMLYAVTNGALVFLIILGLGMFAIFTQWRRMLLREAQTADNLGRYIAQVRSRLNPDGMFAEIDAVLADMDESVERANSRIRRFCAMLRRQLYELPLPAVPVTDNVPVDHPALAAFLTSRRYRLWRLTAALLILTVIASETFFEAPDRPVFSAENYRCGHASVCFHTSHHRYRRVAVPPLPQARVSAAVCARCVCAGRVHDRAYGVVADAHLQPVALFGCVSVAACPCVYFG